VALNADSDIHQVDSVKQDKVPPSCPACHKQYEILYGRPVPWCAKCKSEELEADFKNWSSGNKSIDDLIKNTQCNAKHFMSYLEWIEPARFSDLKFVAS